MNRRISRRELEAHLRAARPDPVLTPEAEAALARILNGSASLSERGRAVLAAERARAEARARRTDRWGWTAVGTTVAVLAAAIIVPVLPSSPGPRVSPVAEAPVPIDAPVASPWVDVELHSGAQGGRDHSFTAATTEAEVLGADGSLAPIFAIVRSEWTIDDVADSFLVLEGASGVSSEGESPASEGESLASGGERSASGGETSASGEDTGLPSEDGGDGDVPTSVPTAGPRFDAELHDGVRIVTIVGEGAEFLAQAQSGTLTPEDHVAFIEHLLRVRGIKVLGTAADPTRPEDPARAGIVLAQPREDSGVRELWLVDVETRRVLAWSLIAADDSGLRFMSLP